jgi:hypothetical protein
MCQRNIGDAMNLVNGQKCLHFVTDVAVDNILLQINARQKARRFVGIQATI